MGRRLVPGLIVSAILAFAAASATMGLTVDHPQLWRSGIALIVLGGITPMIYAVNIRIVPVFSRRAWQRYPQLRAGVVTGAAGGWTVFAGRAAESQLLERLGHAAALAGAALFVASVIMLFRSPVVSKVAPPLPYPEHAEVDRVATRFMRLASMFLLLGTAIGLMLTFWTPERGRWDLVWAHTLLLGWFLSMASGVVYHTLSRWTGGRWRSHRRVRAHLALAMVGLPLMLLALATDVSWLFAIAGPVMAVALLLLVWNAIPLARRLPGLTREAMILAGVFLALGVLLGASIAVDPGNHTRMRVSHAQINLIGWAGLLISGVGYYLFPRFAGSPLPWPRLARVQIVTLALGAATSAVAWWWRLAVDADASVVVTAAAFAVSASFVLYAVIVAETFRRASTVVTSSVKLQPRRASQAP